MPVRVIFPDAETYFTYATAALANLGYVRVYSWNEETNTREEIAAFSKNVLVRVEVIRDGAVIETILGYATARRPVMPSRTG